MPHTFRSTSKPRLPLPFLKLNHTLVTLMFPRLSPPKRSSSCDTKFLPKIPQLRYPPFPPPLSPTMSIIATFSGVADPRHPALGALLSGTDVPNEPSRGTGVPHRRSPAAVCGARGSPHPIRYPGNPLIRFPPGRVGGSPPSLSISFSSRLQYSPCRANSIQPSHFIFPLIEPSSLRCAVCSGSAQGRHDIDQSMNTRLIISRKLRFESLFCCIKMTEFMSAFFEIVFHVQCSCFRFSKCVVSFFTGQFFERAAWIDKADGTET